MAGQSVSRRAVWVLAGVIVATGLVAGTRAAILLPVFGAVLDGPAVLVRFESGASPYTGIGRYEGGALCTAFLLDTGQAAAPARSRMAPVYVLTSGHCVASTAPNEVLRQREGVGRVIFNYFVDSRQLQFPVFVARTVYSTMKGRDLAVLELDTTWRQLDERMIRPWTVAPASQVQIGDPIAIVGVPFGSSPSDEFLRLSTCRIEGVVPLVVEQSWFWFDAQFNHCRDLRPGSSGSPAISLIERQVVGVLNTSTHGATPMTECGRGFPCEPGSEATGRPDVNYVIPLSGIRECFTARGWFDLTAPACRLDRGSSLHVNPTDLGPVNPTLHTQPIGGVRQTWKVTVSGQSPFYRYAVVRPPERDCGITAHYSAAVSMADGTLDMPLPLTDGVAFLCIRESSGVEGDSADFTDAVGPTVVMARIDTTPPRLPAQVAVDELAESWRVTLRLVGEEIAFYAVKMGASNQVSCDDPAGYELAHAAAIGLPKSGRSYRLCVIPYDAAQNPGRLLTRVIE